MYDALCAVSPLLHAFAKNGTQAVPYLSEPYPSSKEELDERTKRQIREAAEGFRALVAMKNAKRREERGEK